MHCSPRHDPGCSPRSSDEHGATPVPLEALAAHMQAQRERFAPSFWHQHQTWLPVGLIGSVVCMAMSGGIANGVLPGSLLPSWLSLFWLGVMTLLIVFGVFRVQRRRALGGTRRGRRDADRAGRAARGSRCWRANCGARHRARVLVLGELLQQEVVLDPYLLLERGGERVCLGIWDGRRIIAAHAELTAPAAACRRSRR